MKVMETRRRTRMAYFFSHMEKSRGNAPLKEKGYCSHIVAEMSIMRPLVFPWTLHPDLHTKRNKNTRKTPPRETTS
jgi:hypothetical protein